MRSRSVGAFALVIVAGCGGGGGGGDPGPATGELSILVLVGGVPEPGVDVVFHSGEDGAVRAHLATDSAGRASEVIDRGDAITIAWLDDFSDRELVTFTDLKPLEDLTVELSLGFDSPVNTTVEIVADPFPGAVDYIVDHPCGLQFSGDPGGTIELLDECFDPPGNLDIAIDAEDADGEPVAWTVARDVPVSENGSVTITMPAWRTDFDTVHYEFTATGSNGPPSALLMSGTLVDGTVVAGNSSAGAALPGTATMPRLPPGPEQALLTMLLADGSWFIDVDPEFPDAVTIDAADALPGPVTVSAAGLGLSARPEVTWSGPSVPGHDATIAILSWDDGSWNRWSVYARPRATGDLTFPALPDALAAFRPDGADEATLSVNHVESSRIFGYGDFRREGHLRYLDFPASGAQTVRIWWGETEYP